MMNKKISAGLFFSIIYLLVSTVVFIQEAFHCPPDILCGGSVMTITIPWSLFVWFMLDKLPMSFAEFLISPLMSMGFIIMNAIILYFLGKLPPIRNKKLRA